MLSGTESSEETLSVTDDLDVALREDFVLKGSLFLGMRI